VKHTAELKKLAIICVLCSDTNTNVVLFQENEALLEQNLRLEQELKEMRLDLRIEKREVEKKASLLTFIREREAKNKERISELEAKLADLEASLESVKYVTTFPVFCAEYLSGIDLHRILRYPVLQLNSRKRAEPYSVMSRKLEGKYFALPPSCLSCLMLRFFTSCQTKFRMILGLTAPHLDPLVTHKWDPHPDPSLSS
jgi:hypothetical protein